MDLLQELIWSIGEEGRRQFRKYLPVEDPTKDSKSLRVYRKLCTLGKVDTNQMVLELYGQETPKTLSAYRNIRLRMKNQVENFIVQQSDKSDIAQQVSKLTTIARKLYLNQKYHAAWSYLSNAEEIAADAAEFELLNYVYQYMIEFSGTQSEQTLYKLIERERKNQEQVHVIRSLSLAQSLIRNRLRELSVKGKIANIDEISRQALDHFGVKETVINNATYRYKWAMLVKIGLEEKKEYRVLYRYLIDTIEEMDQNQMFDKRSEHYKMDMMRTISTAAVMIGDFDVAMTYIGRLEEQFSTSGQTDGKVGAQIHMVRVCWYIVENDNQAAFELLQSFRNKNEALYQDDDYYFQRFNYNMASVLLSLGNVAYARKCMNELLSNPKRLMSGFGMEGLFYCHATECLLAIHAKDYDFATYRISSIERKFRDYLQQDRNYRNKEFMKLMRKITKEPDCWGQLAFRDDLMRFIDLKKEYTQGPEFISFNHWLYTSWKGIPYNEFKSTRFEWGE